MDRRSFLKTASLGAASSAVSPRADAAGQAGAPQVKGSANPNILFVVSDQHRAGLSKRSGYPLDTSPTLDALAARGVAFDRAYCTAPLCMPCRVSMLTGRWPDAHRVRNNDMVHGVVYGKHVYEIAKENGYRTGLAGKNHTFLTRNDLDFWREYGLDDGYIAQDAPESHREFQAWMKGLHANVALEPTPFPLEVQFPYRIVSDAIDFIEGCGDKPFMLQVGFSEPHDPEQVPAPYWNMFPPESVPPRCAGPEVLPKLGFRAQWEYQHQEVGFHTEEIWRRYKSNYLGMLRLIDDQLARLLSFLDERKLTENTIVVYLADHGDYVMDYGLARKGVGLCESLARIPMVWAGPGIRPSRVGETAHVSMADFMPTICDALGVAIPHGVQGRSLWPLLQGAEYPQEEFRSSYVTAGVGGLYYDASDRVPPFMTDGVRSSPAARAHPLGWGFDELNKVSQSGLQKMVRMGDWKLIFDMMGYGQLYHLPSDPCELKNLFGEPHAAAEQARLMAELLMWAIRTEDSLPTGTQNVKWETKWPAKHNWYAPYRHGEAPEAFIP